MYIRNSSDGHGMTCTARAYRYDRLWLAIAAMMPGGAGAKPNMMPAWLRFAWLICFHTADVGMKLAC
jgi:hypothetical protein